MAPNRQYLFASGDLHDAFSLTYSLYDIFDVLGTPSLLAWSLSSSEKPVAVQSFPCPSSYLATFKNGFVTEKNSQKRRAHLPVSRL